MAEIPPEAMAKLLESIEKMTAAFDKILVAVGEAPTKPIEVPKPVVPPPIVVAPPAESLLEKPGVASSIGGGIIGVILQLLGVVGTPAVVGTNPTDAGTAVTILPALSALFGAAGGWRGLITAGRRLFGI